MTDTLTRPDEDSKLDDGSGDDIDHGICVDCYESGKWLKTVCGMDIPPGTSYGEPGPDACAMCIYEAMHGYVCPGCGHDLGG